MTTFDSIIFSGLGYSLGKHRIENSEIENAIERGFLKGFDKARIEESGDYKSFAANHPEVSPFRYFAEQVMGFTTRYYVVPFPPSSARYSIAENSLDLCIQAVENAIACSGIQAEKVDAWMVSTATPHQQAPGLAETLKGYFTGFENKSQTMTLTSACVGFNYNLERAVMFLRNHPEAKHIVVAHAEVMSELLVNETDFVPFVTFGDSAAAVVVSRITTRQPEGVMNIVNYEDVQMLDFLGANKQRELYMNARMVKRRAVPNITSVFNELLTTSGWSKSEVSHFVPHQTGNAIVHEVARNMGLLPDMMFQDVQQTMGNLSGASVPAVIAMLHESGRLLPGNRLIASVAGLGGEFGGFSYIVPDFRGFNSEALHLKGKTALITGATGALGSAIAAHLAKHGANLIVVFNSNTEKIKLLKDVLGKYKIKLHCIQCDFGKPDSMDKMIDEIKREYASIEYMVHTAAISGMVDRATKIPHSEMQRAYMVNKTAIQHITDKLMHLVSETVLFTGSVAEDARFAGSSAYVASKNALHAYAAGISTKIQNTGARCIYYMPGIIDGGMGNLLNREQKAAGMMQIEQNEPLETGRIAERMVKSLYLPKVTNTRDSFENNLLVRKDGYFKY
ncbi:MAG: SDR family NAD(P)-dependent oxidoreductase [Bacteroidales bacterium]|nr:SDR family NAD(P)-dependent oxidoreductase [Bacteroidales bacterium]HOY38623.1 SDR family NAD(P)-dependent oxidoreductase [Bacteroidales bacterium]